MGRSSAGRRRPRAARVSAEDAPPPAGGGATASGPALSAVTLPRVWQSVGYRPLADPAAARPLFDFAAVPWPDGPELAFGWGAWSGGDRLLAALVVGRRGTAAMVHGPVVRETDDALEVAEQLVAAALDHAAALDVVTVFARPLGLDRIWVRFGFIPVPESSLPPGLVAPGGPGLYAWRGGSALWTFRTTPDE